MNSHATVDTCWPPAAFFWKMTTSEFIWSFDWLMKVSRTPASVLPSSIFNPFAKREGTRRVDLRLSGSAISLALSRLGVKHVSTAHPILHHDHGATRLGGNSAVAFASTELTG